VIHGVRITVSQEQFVNLTGHTWLHTHTCAHIHTPYTHIHMRARTHTHTHTHTDNHTYRAARIAYKEALCDGNLGCGGSENDAPLESALKKSVHVTSNMSA